MGKNANFVSHKKSKQKNQDGSPKLPVASSLVEGEIAINFGKDVETLSIKNESGDVVTFSSDNYYTEKKLGSGFTGENSGVTVTEALENIEITVDQVIDETTSASTDAVSTSAVYDFVTSYTPSITVDQDFSNTASTNPISTKAVYSAITDNELVWTNAFVALSGTVSSHTENTDIHVTAADKTAWGNKIGYAAYDSDDKKIYFYKNNTDTATSICYVDATDFIKDGMVSNVEIKDVTSGGSQVTCLVISFNTDAGKQDINIPLTDIFDASNYYTKSQTSGATELSTAFDAIDDLVGSGFTSSSITEVIIENEKIVSAALNNLDEKKLDASAYTPSVELWESGTGVSSVVLKGSSCTASGDYSVAEGQNTTASGGKSHAEGSNTTASGLWSHAEGDRAIASSQSSHAEGQQTVAGGRISHAEGYLAKANGSYSHAEGLGTVASGNSSHAEGNYTTASGQYSHAEGQNTTASGDYSHVEGQNTTASGDYSHAEGNRTIANGNGSHAEGNDTKASGYSSHAEGDSTKAIGSYSHAEGSYAIASGNCSHAEGDSTKAINYNSHAEGYNTTASGNSSHAEGYNTTASGGYSHAEGGYTTASGYYSHAEGIYARANGDYSHAEGNSTVANNQSEHASGQYNSSYSASTSFGDSGNTLFSVGNGISNSARHNAFEVRQNGDIYITSGNSDIKLQDYIGGSVDLSNYYTKSETSGATEISNALGGKVNSATFIGHTADTDVHFTTGTVQTQIDNSISGKVNTSDIISAITPSNSGSTGPIATKVVAENELIVSNALIDLDERKLDASAYTPTDEASGITAMTGYQIASSSASVLTTDTLLEVIGKLEKRIVLLEIALGGLSLVKISTADYENLNPKDPNTLYIFDD